ncbi:MAG TPA: mannosyltransferase family protein [Anaerolineales bacterium]
MKPARIIVLTWLAWAIIVIALQGWMSARITPQWPDRSLSWTTDFTGPDYQQGQKYLLEPFMNNQVAWDSEYYLAIGVGGYDDPATDLVGPPDNQITLSYSFLPFYPLLIRLFAIPLSVLGLNSIATATLAGVIVSALGALGAMFALYDLTRDSLGEDGALRTAFYLIIFPTGFFLVQVYTEGVFVGLAFGCLAMLRRKKWLMAGILASCTVLTRAVGVAIFIPLFVNWLRTGDWMDLDLEWRQIIHQGIPLQSLGRALLVFVPLITFFVWKFSYYGIAFDFVEMQFFGSAFMDLGRAFFAWAEAWRSIFMGIPERTANYILIFFIFVLGIIACIKTIKNYPEAAWFSLAIIIISFGSGPPSGMHRYILTTPAIFIFLARLGRNPIFDRAWTIFSILWMGALAALFALDMWVA